ncbi:hypothetical protein [Nocardia sp. NPDC019395]|uniref:hypothetical protein n=1 Tax=Nocardia sp. NPDC019395 TaxID=3154686 RepID=UPI0033F054C9
MLLADAAALLVVALVCWAITGFTPFGASSTPPANSTPGWSDRHRPIAEAFPNVIGDKDANNGWNGATCTENDPGTAEEISYRNNARISCTVPADGGLFFDIIDRSGTANAALPPDELFNAMLFGCKTQVRYMKRPSGSTLPVAGCAGLDPARDVDSTDHRIYVFALFPERDQYRYIAVARWQGHTVNQLIDYWWKQLPFDG